MINSSGAETNRGSASKESKEASGTSYLASMTSSAASGGGREDKAASPIHSSIAIQTRDAELSKTPTTISIKRNIKNYYEFKEKLGT